jgi:DNA polymerase-1
MLYAASSIFQSVFDRPTGELLVDFVEMARDAWDEFSLHKPSEVAIDTETTGVTFFDTPFCVQLAWDEGGLQSHYFELDHDPEIEKILTSIMWGAKSWVFHNPKFDLQKMILVGLLDRDTIYPELIEDTEACAHLLDEHQLKGLKKLAKELLGENAEETEELKKERRRLKLKKSDGYHLLPREILVPYAVRDAEYTMRLYRILKPQIEAEEDLPALYRAEMELSLVLLDMEAKGMGVDVPYVEKAAKDYNGKILAQRLMIQEITGMEDLNPNSPPQLMEAFATLGIELKSTNKFVLRGIDHPLSTALLQLRSDSKMHGTYLKPIVDEQRDGVMHPWFRQHNTRTGRMASGGAEDA